jgi:hypothetical protein
MNTKLRQQSALLFGVALFLVALLVGGSLFASQQAKVEWKTEPTGSELVKGYREWTRVNPRPHSVSANIAAQCAAPTTTQTSMEQGSPHKDKYITVYVNEIGRQAMMEQREPHFPVGSIIVKEKLARVDSAAPELLTVMIKREAGYDAEKGDWEYMALDGSGETVRARGRLENCQACHLMVKDSDYVSRVYLPQEIRTKLK